MNRFYRNPITWLRIVLLAGWPPLFIWLSPIITAGLYPLYVGVLISIIIKHLRSIARLHKHGYRLVTREPGCFDYEELAAGQARRFIFESDIMTKGPYRIYMSNPDHWRQRVPEWAKDRREEIVGRVREEYKTKDVAYINA